MTGLGDKFLVCQLLDSDGSYSSDSLHEVIVVSVVVATHVQTVTSEILHISKFLKKLWMLMELV